MNPYHSTGLFPHTLKTSGGIEREQCHKMGQIIYHIKCLANIYLFKVNNRSTRKRWNMFKVNIKSERHQWCRSWVNGHSKSTEKTLTISKVVPETLDFVVFEQVFLRWMKVFTCYPWTQYVNWMYNACSREVLFSKEIKQTWYEVFKYAYLIGLTYSQKICWYELMFRNVITWYKVYKIDQLHP